MKNRQKIDNVSISILVNEDRSTIELYDEDANILFVEVKLSNDQLVSALSRLVHTPVKECIVTNLENVGKERLQKALIFEVHQTLPLDRDTRNKILFKLAKEAADPGWTARDYFNGQNSVFRHGDIVNARTIQFKYVDKEEQN